MQHRIEESSYVYRSFQIIEFNRSRDLDDTAPLSSQINPRPVQMIKEALWHGMGWTGLGQIVIIGRRQSKSNFDANNKHTDDQTWARCYKNRCLFLHNQHFAQWTRRCFCVITQMSIATIHRKEIEHKAMSESGRLKGESAIWRLQEGYCAD